MSRVLVVATSSKTRGGITSVIKAHEQGTQWKEYDCRWLETHVDRSMFMKICYVAIAFICYVFILPFYDMVHFHIGEAPSALRKIPFMVYAKIWRKKTIIHFHSFSPDTTIKGKQSYLYRYLFTKADCVVVLSEYWKREVNAVFPHTKTRVIYNPVVADNTGHSSIYRKKKQILYAGTVNHRKGYDDLIKAFGKIANQHPDWILTIAGNGEIEQGKYIAKKLGISNQVQWLGWVNGNDKVRAFKESTIFCLPSYAEGFPMSVLDAWGYGLPVITTPVGGIPDVAKDVENMLLFSPGDIDALAICLERMICDDNLRSRISIASSDFAKNKFNINTVNAEIGALYKSLLEK